MFVNSQVDVGDNASRLNEQFDKLLNGVDRNLKPENRDRFSSNAATFRTEVKKFIDMHSLFMILRQFSSDPPDGSMS